MAVFFSPGLILHTGTMKEGTDNFKGPMPKVLRGLSSGSLGVCVCVCHSAQPQGELLKTVSGFVGPSRLSLPGLECGGGGAEMWWWGSGMWWWKGGQDRVGRPLLLQSSEAVSNSGSLPVPFSSGGNFPTFLCF